MQADDPCRKEIVVIMTGASGSIYGLRLIEALLGARQHLSLLISDAGHKVIHYETGLDLSGDIESTRRKLCHYFKVEKGLEYYANDDFFAPIASGSSAPDSVVIVPCSMGTVGRIAAGLSGTLIERVADVALKERRELLLVPRETPFNQIHLENLLRLSRAGAQILPAMPAFYQKPESVNDLVDFVVGKILDSLNIDHQLFRRWGHES